MQLPIVWNLEQIEHTSIEGRMHSNKSQNQGWWCMSAVPQLQRLRQKTYINSRVSHLPEQHEETLFVENKDKKCKMVNKRKTRYSLELLRRYSAISSPLSHLFVS